MTYPCSFDHRQMCITSLGQLKHNKGNIIIDSALRIRHSNLWMRICITNCCVCCCFECEVVRSKCTLEMTAVCTFCWWFTVLAVVQKRHRLLQRVLKDSPRNFTFMNSTSTGGARAHKCNSTGNQNFQRISKTGGISPGTHIKFHFAPTL